MEKITNVTKGTDPARVQQGNPAFFVSYQKDGEQCYEWFPIVSAMYTVYDRLRAHEYRAKHNEV